MAEPDRSLLLDIADRSIVEGLGGGQPTMPDPNQLPEPLGRPVGSFVTLHVGGTLNGCIGSIETEEALATCVARQARAAAFADPRLPPLRRQDYDHLDIEISILSPLTEVPAADRAALIESLRPGADGLLIAAASSQAVFLPVVWEQLPSADTFLTQLLLKAGLPAGFWPADLRAFVFSADKFGRRATGSTSVHDLREGGAHRPEAEPVARRQVS